MRTLRKLIAVSVVAVVALLIPTVAPAGAHPAVAVFVGNATTDPTWFPVSPFCGSIPCPAGPNAWSFSSATASVVVEVPGGVNTNPNQVSGSGHFWGWCGHSQAGVPVGPGAGVAAGSANVGSHSFQIDVWVSVGGTIVIVGEEGNHAGAAIVQARPIAANGTVPCLTHGATDFTVVGVGVIVGAP